MRAIQLFFFMKENCRNESQLQLFDFVVQKIMCVGLTFANFWLLSTVKWSNELERWNFIVSKLMLTSHAFPRNGVSMCKTQFWCQISWNELIFSIKCFVRIFLGVITFTLKAEFWIFANISKAIELQKLRWNYVNWIQIESVVQKFWSAKENNESVNHYVGKMSGNY